MIFSLKLPKKLPKIFKPGALYGIFIALVIISALANCGTGSAAGGQIAQAVGAAEHTGAAPKSNPTDLFDDESANLWADAIPASAGGVTAAPSSRISIDVRDANILDVLSVLAVKMGTQIIYLEEPGEVTFKSKNLSASTTFQLLLQKEALDYLVVSGHYVVGKRERLYEDFYNRMLLTRYSMQHISAQILQDLIGQLNIPVENVTVDVNTQEIWVQGTPMALGKFLELIATVDRRQNAAFDTGGTRVVRMPVARADGATAVAALSAQQDLLDDLISNASTDAKVEGGAPRVEEVELFWSISLNISGDPANPIHILWVEGTPDNIAVVRQMIGEISDIEAP